MESFFEHIQILPRVLLIEGAESVPVSRLGGLWGGRIRELDPETYSAVFSQLKGYPSLGLAPAFALADGGAPAPGLRLLYWTLIGRDAIARGEILRRAWDIAGASGRPQERFTVRYTGPLSPGGKVSHAKVSPVGWPLADARWPLNDAPERCPCRMIFPNGLHLAESIAGKERFQTNVHFQDIITAAQARVARWLPPAIRPPFEALRPEIERLASAVGASPHLKVPRDANNKQGDVSRGDLEGADRYPVLQGEVRLRRGPGPLWPLLLAARWLHLGKHTAEGAGRIEFMGFDPLSSKASGARQRRGDT